MVQPWNLGPGLMDFSAIGNLGKTYQSAVDGARKRELDEKARMTFANLGQGLDGSPEGYAKAGQALLGVGDVSGAQSFFGLGEKARERAATESALKSSPFYSGAATTPSASPAKADIGDPTDIETRFIGAVKQAGLTNPIGLGAVAAYGRAESGFSPKNVNRTWSDPSESGQAGQAGGIMSWRAERLANLQSFARQRGEAQPSVETQALFLAQEDPQLIPRLNAAKSPAEANSIMANAWRFAGYDRPGGENARRLAMTQHYASRFGGQGQPQAPAQPAPVQVAETEEDVQRLEAEQAARSAPPTGAGTYAQSTPEQLQAFIQSPTVPERFKSMMREELARRQGGEAPVQVAEAAPQPGAPIADVPAQGAAPAGFNVPGNGLPPNDPYPQVSTQQLYSVLANPRLQTQHAAAKQILDNRLKYSDENAPDKREITRLQAEKLRREVEGEGGRPMTPEERKAYNVRDGQPAFMKKNGDPGFGPAGTSITNTFDAKGESKFNEALGTAQAKRWDGYIAEGDQAQTRLADIQALREASRRLGSQGSSANLKSTIAPFAESLGIKIEGASDIQLYESITNRLAPQLRAAGSGSTSDIEFKGFMRAIGPLSNTPAAREMILDTFEAASRNDVARAEIASRLASGEIPRGQAERELRALPNPLEGFRKYREANPDAVGKAITEVARKEAFDKRGPVKVSSPDQARKLPSGTKIILPDGAEGVVP